MSVQLEAYINEDTFFESIATQEIFSFIDALGTGEVDELKLGAGFLDNQVRVIGVIRGGTGGDEVKGEDGMGAGRVLVHLGGPDRSLSKPMVEVRHGLIEVCDF